jgi:hypothetical protein
MQSKWFFSNHKAQDNKTGEIIANCAGILSSFGVLFLACAIPVEGPKPLLPL